MGHLGKQGDLLNFMLLWAHNYAAVAKKAQVTENHVEHKRKTRIFSYFSQNRSYIAVV